MDGSLSATFDQERSRARLGAIIVPLVALLVGLGVGYVVANRGDTRGPESAEVGPTSTKDGVPIGYARTRAGAVAAASNFEQVRSGPLLLRPEAYKRAIETMASESWGSEGTETAAKDSSTIENEFGPGALIENSVLRYRIENFTRDRADVSVWLVSVIQPESGSPVQIWSTVKYTLLWEDGDWRVSDTELVDSVVPAPYQSPSTTTDSPLNTFESYESPAS